MKKSKIIIASAGIFLLLFSYENISGNIEQAGGTNPVQTTSNPVKAKTKTAQPGSKSVQTKTKTTKPVSKSTQTKSKPVQKSTKSETDNKSKDVGIVKIGTQKWAVANLNVSTFRNGDSIPEARTNKEWVAAGDAEKPAWCYYNNDPKIGQKYGKLYNWYAVNDPRGLAPAGWTLPSDADWAKLANFLGGPGAAGTKIKSNDRWNDGTDGTNETGFTGYPEGYRVENGSFQNVGSMGIWWSTTENNPLSAFDHYLSQSSSLSRSNSPKQRGESVRCLKQ
jgi:uncharacterized protein (TIGR02145 family)